jgi:hypothetical protein
MRALGPTAIKLKETYEQYNTLKEAAAALGVSTMRISILCDKLHIDKWRMKPRGLKTAAVLKLHVCENVTCGKIFYTKKYQRAPHRFCCKKCQGEDLGKKYGFGVHPNNIRSKINENR